MEKNRTLQRLNPLSLHNIHIDDAYWNKYIRLVPDVIIPYQWEILNDRVPDAVPSSCLRNFKIAAGEESGKRGGVVFQDSDVAKWLEAVAYSLMAVPDPALEQTADEVIALLGRAQCDDGYLNTYFTLTPGVRRWENLTEGHELYCAGHLIEAAVAYFEATGKDTFLNIMRRFADLICKTFGPKENQIHGYPGHQEIELAFVKLFRITGEHRYLETAKYFIDERGKTPNYFLQEQKRPDYHSIFSEFANYDPSYSQSDAPVREQKDAHGHAVRATYMYCAMADLAQEYQDEELLEACKRIWKNMTEKRMYITGSIGSSIHMERFTADYDLPNDYNYSETCASIGLALFGLRMANITAEASYIDVVERALYNTVRSGISLEGNRYFYVNPLEVWPQSCVSNTTKEAVKPIRQKWFDVACCPTNVARTLTSLGQYLYALKENHLYVHLFAQNQAEFSVNGQTVQLHVETDFPRSGQVKFKVEHAPQEFVLHVRVPSYAENVQFFRGGKAYSCTVEKGYAQISGAWQEQENIAVTFTMRAKYIRANPQVRADAGKVAIVRGPEVFCLEQTDNGANLSALMIECNAEPLVKWDASLFGGCTVIEAQGTRTEETDWDAEVLYAEAQPHSIPQTLKAIPYGYWCNREPGEMCVWIRAK